MAAVLALVVLLLAAPAAMAQSEPTRSQRFFRTQLLEDDATSRSVKALLRGAGGFVNPTIVFSDLTGDRRDDAIVRVASGGTAGDVAVYVFSTHGGRRDSPLRALYRLQSLVRASTSLADGTLVIRSARYRRGDDLCCPAATLERTVAWRARTRRFVTLSRREIPRARAPAPAG